MSALDQGEAREIYSIEDIQKEQVQIQKTFLSMRFSEQARQTTLSCMKKCGAKVAYPFRVETQTMIGQQEVCFGDCMNVNFEQGPYLSGLGKVPEDVVPKKFIWGHSLP